MTLYFALFGVDFSVTGEKIPGILGSPDRFEIKGIRVRSAAQDIRKALQDSKLLPKLAAAALQHAEHPIPLPYDTQLDLSNHERRYCECGRELISAEQLKLGKCEFCYSEVRPERSAV